MPLFSFMVLLFLGTINKTSTLFTNEAVTKKLEGGAPVKFPQALNIMNTMAMLLIFKLTHCQINISQENSGAFGSVHPHPPTMKSPYYFVTTC